MATRTSRKTDRDPRDLVKFTWHFCDAQALVRGLQALVWPLRWHIALAGSVLNVGVSMKDIDLILLPFNDSNVHGSIDDVRSKLALLMGFIAPIGKHGSSNLYALKEQWSYEGKRVDVFIVHPKNATTEQEAPAEGQGAGLTRVTFSKVTGGY